MEFTYTKFFYCLSFFTQKFVVLLFFLYPLPNKLSSLLKMSYLMIYCIGMR